MVGVDLCSSLHDSNSLIQENQSALIFVLVSIIHIISIILIILPLYSGKCSSWDVGTATISTTQGHFALYNCLVIGNTKYSGVQLYSNPFPAKPFHGSHRMDLVMIRPLGIENGAFVVSPDSVWYARVLHLFSASAMTDTGSKSFDCALV